jgi:hypothetical protein
MRRSEIVITRYRRVSIVESTQLLRTDAVETDCTVTDVQERAESRQHQQLRTKPQRRSMFLITLITRLLKR